MSCSTRCGLSCARGEGAGAADAPLPVLLVQTRIASMTPSQPAKYAALDNGRVRVRWRPKLPMSIVHKFCLSTKFELQRGPFSTPCQSQIEAYIGVDLKRLNAGIFS